MYSPGGEWKKKFVRDFSRGGGNGGSRFGGGRDGGGSRFGGRDGGSRFGGRDGGSRPMHHATCANCGKDCEVPFRPTGDKPVYCSECFEERGGNENRRSNDRDFAPRRFDDRRGGNDSRPQRSGSDNQKQFDELNSKLEAIIDILSSMNKPAKKAKKEAVQEAPQVETPTAEPTAEEIVNDFLPSEE